MSETESKTTTRIREVRTIGIPVRDQGKALDFYRDKLGLEPDNPQDSDNLEYKCGNGTGFLLYESQNAGTAKNTVAVWRMKGIRDEVARLLARGVVFDDYDFGEDGRTVGGILSEGETDINAWFTDCEGNILALAEETA